MLKNYYEINENEELSTFLKNLKDKKNAHYIILNDEKSSFVDIRTIALRIHGINEKLKSFKKPLTTININETDENAEEKKFKTLIESGDRVIKVNEDLYDFISALNYILKQNYSFLKDKLNVTDKKEIYALNLGDKISQARNLFLKNKINLLPVINSKNEIIGELRPIDLMVGKLYLNDSNRQDYYNESYEESKLNLPIDNLINKKPIIIDNQSTYLDVIKLMTDKKLPSIIITNNNNKLFSIISIKDIFKIINKNQNDSKIKLEISGIDELFDDDYELIMDLLNKTANKISNVSDYDLLKISFKTHGNTTGTHKKKFEVKLVLSKGNKIIRVEKEILGGTDDELSNNKIKQRWNTPLLVQEALKVLFRKVIKEKSIKN